MESNEILSKVVERLKDNEYDYEIESFLKRKEVDPNDFKEIIEKAKEIVLEDRLKTMPKRNLLTFALMLILAIVTIYLFGFYLPNTNSSQNGTFLSLIGTATLCVFSFLSLVYYGTWKPQFLKHRDKPKIDFTFLTLFLVPAVIIYFIFSWRFSSGADKLLKATQVDAIGTVIDGGVTEVKRVFRSGGASYASITVEFETKEGNKIVATEDVSTYKFKDFYLGQQIPLVYSSENPQNIDLLIDDENIKLLKNTEQRDFKPKDLIRLMDLKSENIQKELNTIAFGWEKKEEAWINENSKSAIMITDKEVKLITQWDKSREFSNEIKNLGFKQIEIGEKPKNQFEQLFGEKLFENETYYFQMKTINENNQQMSLIVLVKK